MARELCREIVESITGKAVSEKDLERLEKVVSRRAQAISDATPTLTPNEAITRAAEFEGARQLAVVQATKRTALANETKRQAAIAQITGNWGNQLGLGLRSLVNGTQRNVAGARISAAGQQDVVRSQLLGGFHAEIAKLGPDDMRLFLSGAVEQDIARALWQFSQDAPDAAVLKGLNPAAKRIGEVVYRYQELARNMANKEGASIGKYAGYVFQATHDVAAIAADKLGWEKLANETFDLPRMMSEMDFPTSTAMLDSLYASLSTGLHLKSGSPSPTASRGLGSLANRMSKEKVIHFKDADAFMAYNQPFGYGNLREAVVGGLEQTARNVGLMQVLGSNPAAFLDSVEDRLAKVLKERKPTPDQVKRFRQDVQAARNRLREVDGSLDVPGSAVLAKYSQAVRTVQTMASLGGSLLSSFSDIGLFMVGARHNGINVFQAAGSAVSGLFTGKSAAERAQLASSLGVVFDSLNGKMASRFSPDDAGRGAMSAMQQLYFKLNLQTWWTDNLRFAAAEMLSHNLAFNANTAFDALDPKLAKTLGLYGLDAKGWDTARAAVQTAEDGKTFITPDAIADERVAAALRAYFTDQNGYVLLSPDSESRYLTKWNTQKGTSAGELLRFAMQFKSYTVAFTQKMIGRELVGNVDPDVRGMGVLGKAATNGQALIGMTQLVLMTTMFGYLSMSMKDIIKGKEPRDPSDPRTALAAMQQGGGLGIMGDFIFGQQNRVGGGFIGTVMGPTAGDIEAVANLYFKGKEAALDPTKEAELGDDAFRLIYGNIPGNNLFWTKPVLDYLFMWNVNETLNPGAMERMERNAAKQGQEFFISPAERVQEQRAAQ